ncbi:hypothetical protein AYO38_03795 [bacterium SCGC AG-212-C10]|nr:hypothetical protein AYO38_03795 [bacterium SCGC AG-212-C10]
MLLDTEVLIWAAESSPRLSESARAIVVDPTNERLLSAAVSWEMAIKIGLGKLAVDGPLHVFLDAQTDLLSLIPLPIETRHSLTVLQLPQFTNHRDPFDRMLIAQAMTEGIPVVSADRRFAQYGVQVIW